MSPGPGDRKQGDAVRLAAGELQRTTKRTAREEPAEGRAERIAPPPQPEPTADQVAAWARWWVNLSEAIANEPRPGGENPRLVTKDQAEELGRHTARFFAGRIDAMHPLVAIGIYITPGLLRLGLAKARTVLTDRLKAYAAAREATARAIPGRGARPDGLRENEPGPRETVGTFIP